MKRPVYDPNGSLEDSIAYSFAIGEWQIETMRDLLTSLLYEGQFVPGTINRDQGVLIGEGGKAHVLSEDEEEIVNEILEDLRGDAS